MDILLKYIDKDCCGIVEDYLTDLIEFDIYKDKLEEIRIELKYNHTRYNYYTFQCNKCDKVKTEYDYYKAPLCDDCRYERY